MHAATDAEPKGQAMPSSQRVVTFCNATGDDRYRPTGGKSASKQQQQQQKQKQLILTLPYQLTARSAEFRQNYADGIGCSIQGKRPGLGQLGISPMILSKTVRQLGFNRVEEESSDALLADEQKLSMLFLTSAKCDLQLGGPNYLDIKPFVGRMYFMCTKWFLVQSLRRIEHRMRLSRRSFRTGSGRVFNHKDFTPFTLNLNDASLEDILAEQPGAYLAKPARGSMGERQQLVHIRKDRVREDLLNFLLTSQFREMRRSQVILQRYIERPLLVDKRKFDMRVYMLVVNAKRGGGIINEGGGGGGPSRQSGYFVFLHPGFLRLCTPPYHPEHTDLAVHLTNQSVQAKHTSTFGQLKEVTTWYPDELNQYLNRRHRLPQKDWTKDVLYPKVGAILGYISAVFRRHLDDRDCPTNTFRILGVDLLVDEDLRLYLLEFNSHPSWGRQTSVLNRLKPNIWREAASLTSEVVLRYRSRSPIRDDALVTRQNFRIIYSSDEPAMARQNVARLYD